MVCPKCQQDLVPHSNFCHACGHMHQAFCRACKLKLPNQSNFCFQCGDNVHEADLTPYAVSASLEAVPPRAIDVPAPRTTGERKHVSVLFADLSGFTSMSERLDPERVTEIVNSCFNRLGKVVYSFEGYIDKFMGDCIMALFGAPIAHENDPELSIRCALALLKELDNFNRESGQKLGMSIGINSGLVVAGQVGTDQKLEYTVMGDAVNLAQRLQSSAESGQILVSEAIYKSCEKLFDFESLDPISVKGKERPVQAFRVAGEKLFSSSQKELSARSFVGREVELKVIQGMLERASSGSFSLLGIAGEAGVGKSRLKHETKKKAKNENLEWFESKCDRFNREAPYFLFHQLLNQLLQDHSLEESPLDPVSRGLIREVLHHEVQNDEISYLEGTQRKQSTFVAIRRFLDWRLREVNAVLYFEDLHWIDPLSLELFEFVLPDLSRLSVFVYGSYRPDFEPPWSKRPDFQSLKLEPLSPEQSVKLTKAILKLEDLPEELETLIREKSDGNPLYVEEILKSLVDQGKITKRDDVWKISSNLSGIQVPTTLQGLIASRIDKLDRETKLILQYASVIGRQFESNVLQTAANAGPEFETYLEQLQERGLVFRLPSSRTPEYVFKHALTQEVAYQSILKRERKLFHERVGFVLEAQATRQDEIVETLARHFTLSGNTEKGFEYSLRAARHLAGGFSNEGAIKHYLSAIQIYESELMATQGEESLVEICLELAEVYVLIGDFENAELFQRKVLSFPGTQKRPSLQSKCYRRLGDISRFRGKLQEMRGLLEKALHLSLEDQDEEGIYRTYKALGFAYKISNDLHEAIDYLQKALEGARRLKIMPLVAECLNDIATVKIAEHSLDDAETHLLESVDISSQIPRLRSLVVSSTLNLGVIEYYRSNFDRALLKFQEASRIAQEIGDLKNLLISKHNIGEILREFERDKEAIQEFQESYDLARDMGNEIEKINNLILIGYLKTRLQEEEKGEKILRECMLECQEHKYWLYYCDALYFLGKYYQRVSKDELAIEAFETSRAKATEIQANHAVKRCDDEIKKLNISPSQQPKNTQN